MIISRFFFPHIVASHCSLCKHVNFKSILYQLLKLSCSHIRRVRAGGGVGGGVRGTPDCKRRGCAKDFLGGLGGLNF